MKEGNIVLKKLERGEGTPRPDNLLTNQDLLVAKIRIVPRNAICLPEAGKRRRTTDATRPSATEGGQTIGSLRATQKKVLVLGMGPEISFNKEINIRRPRVALD